MPKAARLVVSRAAPTASSESSNIDELISIALFSGIGLLITFVGILFGVQGTWY